MAGSRPFQKLNLCDQLGPHPNTSLHLPGSEALTPPAGLRFGKLWPNQNPIDRSLRLGADNQFHCKNDLVPDASSYQVIGVARHIRGIELDGSDSRQIYMPFPRAAFRTTRSSSELSQTRRSSWMQSVRSRGIPSTTE